MPKFEQWVHVKITDKELAVKLNAMCAADERDRSKFMRWMIQQEWLRRQAMTTPAHWVGESAVKEKVTA